MTRTFASIARCKVYEHRAELLTMSGVCPRCTREAFAASMAVAENAREAARLQAITNVHAGKRRAA